MGIVKNANCVWPRNLQQYEREGHRYKTTTGTKSEGEKTLGISHKWGREDDTAGPQRLQVQQEGLIHYSQRYNYIIRKTESNSDLTVCLKGLC